MDNYLVKMLNKGKRDCSQVSTRAQAQGTVGQNSQELGREYWATRVSVRSFARTAHFACSGLLASLLPSAALTRSLTRSLRSLPRSWESEFLTSQNDLVLSHSALADKRALLFLSARAARVHWDVDGFTCDTCMQHLRATLACEIACDSCQWITELHMKIACEIASDNCMLHEPLRLDAQLGCKITCYIRIRPRARHLPAKLRATLV